MKDLLPQQRPVHVLVVDKEIAIRDVFSSLLVSQGYAVSTSTNPLEALEMAKSKMPDVVFTSLIFKEMSGLELCKALRAIPESSSMLIAVLTGYSSGGILNDVRGAGGDCYFLKPVDFVDILSLLTAVREKIPVSLRAE